MPDENDELNEMLQKYHAPAEAGEAVVLRDIALDMWGRFSRGEEGGGDWYRPVYISKKEARHYRKQHAPAGLILPDQRAMVDFDPRKVAEIFARSPEEYGRGMVKEILAGLPRVIDWLVKFEQALRDDEGDDEEVEVEA
jgi:hypothetical protein